MDINTNILRNIVTFLSENEQYGDDWSVEIAEMDKLIEYIDAKNGKYNFPPYETILNTCLEDVGVNDAYVVYLPLGYRVEFVHDGCADIVWADFYDKDDKTVSRIVFWDDNSPDDAEKLNFEYYLDHFFNKLM